VERGGEVTGGFGEAFTLGDNSVEGFEESLELIF